MSSSEDCLAGSFLPFSGWTFHPKHVLNHWRNEPLRSHSWWCLLNLGTAWMTSVSSLSGWKQGKSGWWVATNAPRAYPLCSNSILLPAYAITASPYALGASTSALEEHIYFPLKNNGKTWCSGSIPLCSGSIPLCYGSIPPMLRKHTVCAKLLSTLGKGCWKSKLNHPFTF